MNLEYILLIIVFFFLRKTLKSKILLPKIDQYLFVGFYISIVLLITSIIFDASEVVLGWIAHLMLIGLLYFSLTLNEFKPVKSIIYSILPFVIVNFLKDFTELINTNFYTVLSNYFETGIAFSIIWFFAMFFINKKQRKDIESEQLKAIEREKDFQQSEMLKEKLEIQVAERTAELLSQKDELQIALDELKSTQSQLIQSEKMASLGELTAGIAHEIQNPLNFVNNFSEVSNELIDEMKEEFRKGDVEEGFAIADYIKLNLDKINHHGKRADAIVKGMLQHSRSSSGVKEPTDINALADEYLRLAYHGLRAKDKSFNATLVTNYDETIGNIDIIPQDMGRVILNLITNAFYAVNEKKKQIADDYEPNVSVSTLKISNIVQISVKDNGNGIPQTALDKIFQPFFTTKPAGQGTGLGLSLAYDIVKAHNAELRVETKEGEGSEFIIELPVTKN
ncbi:MAG: two-component system NtrC family sensor kinase [Flavobacterium sp.]|jgi:two-component system NtrC family sensor kinase